VREIFFDELVKSPKIVMPDLPGACYDSETGFVEVKTEIKGNLRRFRGRFTG